MFARAILPRIQAALADTPVVVLHGARQTGKSTLAQAMAPAHAAEYLTLDSLATLAAARNDPVSFLAGLRGKNVFLDEIQLAPELFLSIKAEVDRRREPGRFLLTGSANVMLLPRLAEALVGRMELITLWPLAQCEIEDKRTDFIELAFQGEFGTQRMTCERQDVVRRALTGGYPEAVKRVIDGKPDRLADWFEAYVATLLQRDVRDLANIHGLAELPLLIRLIASRTTGMLNVSDLSRASRIPNVTLSRYLTLLQAIFLIQLVSPWSGNLSSRLVKSPKLLLVDTGVLGYLNGLSAKQMSLVPSSAGPLIENFAGMELVKLCSWNRHRPQLFYYRTHDRKEVDFVLQDRSGKVVGVEVKASATIDATDFKGLQALADDVGKSFACGVMLYTGETVLPFGKRLFAVPLAALWQPL